MEKNCSTKSRDTVPLNVSKQLFLNFHFFHWFKLDLVKMAKLACDLLCWRMRHMRQHFASVCGACGSTLLLNAAHTLANCQRMWRIRQQNRVKMTFCKSMLRMRLQITSVYGACGSTLLAYAAHAVATCQRRRCIRQQIARVCAAYGSTLLAWTAHAVARTKGYTRRMCIRVEGACGSTLLAYAAHTIAICQRRQRIRQQFSSVCGACGSKLLAQTAHTVAICQCTRRMRQQNRVKLCVLLTQTAHTVANCQRMRRMRQHFASLYGACGSNLLAQRLMWQLKQNGQYLTHL